MMLISLAPKLTPGVVPDVDDPNLYCCSCKYIYSTRSVFRSHLKNVHKIDLGERICTKIDYECSIFHRYYKSKRFYTSHMRIIHKNES